MLKHAVMQRAHPVGTLQARQLRLME